MVRVLLSGRVQGVAFRWSTREEACRLGLTGWVRNLADGRVEALIAGPAARVGEMLQWCAEGPPAARVSSIESDEVALAASPAEFSVLPTAPEPAIF